MHVFNRALKLLLSPILARNKKFIDLHKGETCYIIGNGATLKCLNFQDFADHPAIGLNQLCLHNDIGSLNLKYYVVNEPYFFYPRIKNFYNGKKFQVNHLGLLLKRAFFSKLDIPFFTSASNIFGIPFRNSYFLHHFGEKVPNKNKNNICGSFSFMKGALYAGVGLAINMGFSRAYLIGCDYLLRPKKMGHFYTFGPSYYDPDDQDINFYSDLIKEVDGLIELSVIAEEGGSAWIPVKINNSLKFNKYKENNDIVDTKYLNLLNKAVEDYQLINDVYQKKYYKN